MNTYYVPSAEIRVLHTLAHLVLITILGVRQGWRARY